MTILSLVMTLISIGFLWFVIRLIRNDTFTINYALTWLLVGVVLLIFSLLPAIPAYLAKIFGFEVTSNFLLFAAVLFCLIQLILFTMSLTKQSNYIKSLVQEVSLLKKEIEEKNKEQ
ncbi:hypothetical protein CBF34_02970 [Vagococcus penaei]|uniref:Uncharacterized protein n=1 Tax=Vagococcus penaei TaxID=633807 RepID=A0A1Q2D3W4_9ENTE|nr:DUF2304 domain-containing protein [Vagococcus penaei]AQP53049.1 hypothetical protein BW732_01615 [Vagococcus penaei]RSU06088.1 hypothetical protein CBF34_02970 [Vagococcus penaei]